MAIGDRIRFFRNLRGMTQKWLGTAVGFSPKTADIRLAQYESGSRTPKKDMVNALANYLNISPMALDIPDIDTDFGLIHTLFRIEDSRGVKVKEYKREEEIHIIFQKASSHLEDLFLFEILSTWASEAEKYRNGKIAKEQYDQWRYRFPEDAAIRRRLEFELELKSHNEVLDIYND